jgi:hypothetical protein
MSGLMVNASSWSDSKIAVAGSHYRHMPDGEPDRNRVTGYVGRRHRKSIVVDVSATTLTVTGTKGCAHHRSERLCLLKWLPEIGSRFTVSKGSLKYTAPSGASVYFNERLTLDGTGEVFGATDIESDAASLGTRRVNKAVKLYATAAVNGFFAERVPPALLVEWGVWWLAAGNDAQLLWNEIEFECRFAACWLCGGVFVEQLGLLPRTSNAIMLLANQPVHRRQEWLKAESNAEALAELVGPAFKSCLKGRQFRLDRVRT